MQRTEFDLPPETPIAMPWILVATTLLALLAAWNWWTCSHFRRRGVVYVRPVPFLGNMAAFATRTRSLSDVVNGLYRSLDGHSFGGVFSFTRPVLMLRDPQVIRTITVKDFDHFTDHQAFISEEADPIFAKNLFALKGQRWRDMRATLSPAFTSSKIKSMFLLMNKIGQQMTDFLMEETQKRRDTRNSDEILTLEMKEFFTFVTNDIVATTAFGVEVDSLTHPKNDFYLMGKFVTGISVFRNFIIICFLLMPRIMKLTRIKFIQSNSKKFFLDLITRTIETRQKEGIVRPDMIHLMMKARKGKLESKDDGKQKKVNLSDMDIAAQAMVFFFAGFDTVSALMSFTAFLLATHHDVQMKLQTEVDNIMNGSDGKPIYENVQAMKYLDMVILETLRMYPPSAAVDRECVKAYQMPDTSTDKGYLIQPGDVLWVPIHALHHDPQYFPDPEIFDPERFSEENRTNIKPFSYVPFGSGPRICIAQRFAILETKIILTHLLSKFNLVKVPETAENVRLENRAFNISMKGGTWIGLRKRPYKNHDTDVK